MGNKFVRKNLLINGVIGAIAVTLFCAFAGLQDALGVAWIIGFLLGDLIGIIIYICKVVRDVKKNPLPKKTKAQYEQELLDKRIALEYSFFLDALTDAHIARLGNIMYQVLQCMQARQIHAPENLKLFLMAIIRRKNLKQPNQLSLEKITNINNQLDMLEFDFHALFVISQKQAAQSAEKGLDFGVIGSAADIALFNILDTLERAKNVTATQHATTNRVSDTIKTFCREVTIILAN